MDWKQGVATKNVDFLPYMTAVTFLLCFTSSLVKLWSKNFKRGLCHSTHSKYMRYSQFHLKCLLLQHWWAISSQTSDCWAKRNSFGHSKMTSAVPIERFLFLKSFFNHTIILIGCYGQSANIAEGDSVKVS